MSDGQPGRPFDLTVTGDLILPGRVLVGGTLGVRNGKIAAIFELDESPDAARHVDYCRNYIFPGLVDSHVHTGSASAEGIARATAAAAAGGVTTVVDMPYDDGAPVFTGVRLTEKGNQVQREALVDVGLYGSIRKHEGLAELEPQIEAGALAFKFSLFETDAQRFPRILDGDLFAAFNALASTDLPIVLHAELEEVINRELTLETARDDPRAHGRTRPVASEMAAVAKALDLALWSGAKIHIAHVTHPHGFKLVQWYQQQGARVSAETCVHYLAFSEEDVCEIGAIAKVNPPIRDQTAREGLWEALFRRMIPTVSTDHAPWPLATKQRPMLDAASGVPGLETFLPAMWTEATRRDLPPWRLAEIIADNPATLFGLAGKKGRLDVGYDADLVVFDPDREWTFDASHTFTSAKWSPFDGRTFRGKVRATYLRGGLVFESGELTAEPGTGQLLRPSRQMVAPAVLSDEVRDRHPVATSP